MGSRWIGARGVRRGVWWGDKSSGQAVFKYMTQAVRLSGSSAHVVSMHFQTCPNTPKGSVPSGSSLIVMMVVCRTATMRKH